jgi:outer membrane protein TolC
MRREHSLLAGALLALLSACSGYRPQPLQSAQVEAVLADPTSEQLTTQAAAIRHPLIAPVKLDFAQALSLDAISVIAVVASPELLALRAQEQVADAQVFASGLFPDPQLSLSVDRVLSPTGEGLVTGFVGGLSFDALGELFVRRKQVNIARSLREQLRLDIAWAEWNTAGNARLLATRLVYLQAAVPVAAAADELAAQTLVQVQAAVRQARLKGDDLQTQTQLAADAAVRAATLRREQEDTRQQLNSLLGLSPATLLQLDVTLAADNALLPDAQTAFVVARRQRLDLQALAQGFEAQQQGLKRAVMGQYPRVALTLNRGRDSSAVHSWGPAVSFDLPLWNRNRGEIAVGRADLAQSQAEYAARLHQTRADIAALLAALQSDALLLQAGQQRAASLSRLAADYRLAQAQGAVTRLVADNAQLAALDSQLKALELQQASGEERIGLSLLTGEPFP